MVALTARDTGQAAGPVDTTPVVARTAGADDTRALAGALASLCRVGDVVLLAGDLGAGKTTFAQGFGRALGVVERITSPTFTLVQQYPCEDPVVRTVLHADVYRLDHLSEVVDLGLSELVEDGAVALVEWGDVVAPVFGEGTLVVRLEAGRSDSADSADTAGTDPVADDAVDEPRLVTVSAGSGNSAGAGTGTNAAPDAADTGLWAHRWPEVRRVLEPWAVRP